VEAVAEVVLGVAGIAPKMEALVNSVGVSLEEVARSVAAPAALPVWGDGLGAPRSGPGRGRRRLRVGEARSRRRCRRRLWRWVSLRHPPHGTSWV
jgi:hypothetical protein